MSRPPATIHDAFFKEIIGDTAMAGRFLREHLPPEVAALLGPEPPELQPGSFVDEEFGQHHSDLLFKVGLLGGGEALVHLVVVEHKSAPDPLARLQLLRYVVRILVDRLRQAKGRLPLPVVIPLLVHHGPSGWAVSPEFADLFGPVPEVLRPYLPSFRHALVDLVHVPDDALSADVRLRVRLKALKYVLRPDLTLLLDVILAEAASLEDVDVVLVLTYIIRAPADIGEEAVREALDRVIPSRREMIMANWTQRYVDEGIAKGMMLGKAEGVAQGKAEALTHVLVRRFGAVPERYRAMIAAADADRLDRWFDRAFDASDIETVFDGRSDH